MRINFQTIPHKKQRYDTVGDYYLKGDVWNFRVSKMSDWRYEMLVFVHEIVEWMWVFHTGVEIGEIDEFDMLFTGEGEPGDSPEAPYYRGHQIANVIERMVAFSVGVRWDDYEKEVNNL